MPMPILLPLPYALLIRVTCYADTLMAFAAAAARCRLPLPRCYSTVASVTPYAMPPFIFFC